MSEHNNTRQLALKVGLLQTLLLALSGLICLLNQSVMATAAFVGAAIGLMGSTAFAVVSLSTGNGWSAGRIMFKIYIAQATRYMLIFAGLITAYSTLPGISRYMNVVALLGALLLSQFAYLIAPSLGSTENRPDRD